MTGGYGPDTFVFVAFNGGKIDEITDFKVNEETLFLTGVAGDDPEAQFDALTTDDVQGGIEVVYAGHVIAMNDVPASELGLDRCVFL